MNRLMAGRIVAAGTLLGALIGAAPAAMAMESGPTVGADTSTPNRQALPPPEEAICRAVGKAYTFWSSSRSVSYPAGRMCLRSSPRSPVAIVFQRDGNLVLYRGNRAVWSSNTHSQRVTGLAFQTDGNVVIYRGRQPVWATNTHGKRSGVRYLFGPQSRAGRDRAYLSLNPRMRGKIPTEHSGSLMWASDLRR